MSARLLSLASICGMTALWLTGASAFATPVGQPTLIPDPSAVIAGNAVTVTLTDPTVPSSGVLAVDLEVLFDPTALAFDNVGIGASLAGWGPAVLNLISSGDELISIAECGLCNDAMPGDLLSLTFDALPGDATGSTSFSAATAGFAVGGYGEYQLSSLAGTIDITAAMNTSPIPAPGITCLILPALILARSRRRRD